MFTPPASVSTRPLTGFRAILRVLFIIKFAFESALTPLLIEPLKQKVIKETAAIFDAMSKKESNSLTLVYQSTITLFLASEITYSLDLVSDSFLL